LCDGEIRTVPHSKNGISINLTDKWDDLLHNVIPAIHCHYVKFANVEPGIGWLYDHNSDLEESELEDCNSDSD